MTGRKLFLWSHSYLSHFPLQILKPQSWKEPSSPNPSFYTWDPEKGRDFLKIPQLVTSKAGAWVQGPCLQCCARPVTPSSFSVRYSEDLYPNVNMHSLAHQAILYSLLFSVLRLPNALDHPNKLSRWLSPGSRTIPQGECKTWGGVTVTGEHYQHLVGRGKGCNTPT